MTFNGRMCCGVKRKLLGARFICQGGGSQTINELEATDGVGASLRHRLF
jgi:hypothetical protein